VGDIVPALSRDERRTGDACAVSGSGWDRALAWRIFAVVLILGVEILAASLFLDGDKVAPSGPLTEALHDWGAWVLRSAVCFAGLFATFAYLKNKAALQQLSLEFGAPSVRSWLLMVHVAAITIFGVLAQSLYRLRPVDVPAADWVAAVWLASAGIAVASVWFAFFPGAVWLKVLQITGNLWAFSLGATVLTLVATNPSRALWHATARLTFRMVKFLLSGIFPDMVTDASLMMIRTQRFRVFVSPECSGLEGAGLILAFGIVWLWLFRKECRFPQALALIPAGVVLIFLLNALRIAVLVLIGDAGARQIAAGGFHSQAGWITFNAVAFGISLVARRSPVFSLRPAEQEPIEQAEENPAAAYLMPLLGILAAGMVATAASGTFEWLYPLRFAAAIAFLWFFRDKYLQLDWRFGWLGPAIGTLVFFLWLAAERWAGRDHASAMPDALLNAAAATRFGWIAVRTVATVVTVPLAEELAFRGYLMRRLIATDFESVGWARYSWLAVILSSLAFGALHGARWLPGATAGALYAFAMLRKGRIGEAVAAHATTNLLISFAVLHYNHWELW